MNAPSIGLNLRVTGYCNPGGRKYMEDVFSVAYQQTEDENDLEYAFFGIFDGHGGREAALFAKEHLMDFIVRQKGFWASDDESVLRAIHEGFLQTHQAMWKELERWPKTASGLPSTAGTTASVAFIRRSKIYVGHVGDSAIVLGVQDPECPNVWRCEPLTRDHKPESVEESKRIEKSGGKVICKSGVPRVVWNRPKVGHKGPIRRSTPIDEIPFLAVARSLGDLWSYNSEEDVFVVSPEPDTYVYPIDISKHRCLILGTDGAWNMLSPQQSVALVCQAEKANEQHMLRPSPNQQWINPSKRLVDKAIERWKINNLRADNTSVVTVLLDPPGPPRAQVLQRQRELAQSNDPSASLVNAKRGSVALVTNTTPVEEPPVTPVLPPPPKGSTPLPVLSTNDHKPPKIKKQSNSSSSTNEPAIQCNEISSSEDESPLKCRPLGISRELNNLRIDSHGTRRRIRTTSESNTSDTENEGHRSNRAVQFSEKRLLRSSVLPELTTYSQSPKGGAKRKKYEKSVSSLGERFLRSTATPRSLRSALRWERKRKGEDSTSASYPSKSPKVNDKFLSTKKPVVTRSKSARVLTLKK